MDIIDYQDEIPFDKTPPVYGPELPEWWQLALAGYEVACHLPKDWISDRRRWRPEHPPQLDGSWFLIAIGDCTFLLDEHYHDDGRVEYEWEYETASFWAHRPPHVEGPTARTFAEVKDWATSLPMEREAASVCHMLAAYQGDDPEAF